MPRKPVQQPPDVGEVEFARLAATLSKDPRVDAPEVARAKGFGSKELKVARKTSWSPLARESASIRVTAG